MQFVLSPLFKKMNKDIKLSYSFTVENIRQGLLCLELELLKYFKQQITVGCFNKSGQEINIDSTDENTIMIRPAVVVGGSKAFRIIIGVVLIIVGVILTLIPGWEGLGVGLIMYGAGMLLNELLMPKPVIPGDTETDDFKDAPSYSFANFANKIGEDYPVPLVYGYSTSAGVLIDYVENSKVFFRGDKNTINTVVTILENVGTQYWDNIGATQPGGAGTTIQFAYYDPPYEGEVGGAGGEGGE